MADRCHIEPAKLYSTLKNTVFKACTEDELIALVLVANEYQLNPLTKQIYAFPKKGGGIEPMIPIDGWLQIANHHPQFDGLKVEEIDNDGKPYAVEVTIHRKDRSHPIVVREYLSECARPTEPWKQMPRRMLRHKGIKECARIAFSLSGLHDEDECRDIERNVSGRVVATNDDPMLRGLNAAPPAPEPSIDDKIRAKAEAMGIDVEGMIVDAAHEGKISEENFLDKLSDEDKQALLAL